MKIYRNKQGYGIVTVPGRGQMRNSRFVMERQVKRFLGLEEQVHHVGLTYDDRPDNLELYANAKDHSRQRNRIWPPNEAPRQRPAGAMPSIYE